MLKRYVHATFSLILYIGEKNVAKAQNKQKVV